MSTLPKMIKVFAYLLAICIIAAICSAIYHTINAFVPTTEKVVVEDYYKEFKDIKSLDLNINAADIKIEKGEKFSIKAENLVSKIKVKEEDGILKVKQNKVRITTQSAGSIIITIPTKLDKFVLNGGAGKVDITNLKAKKAKLSLGFGSVKISEVDLGPTDISGGAGKISIEKSAIQDLDLSSGSGSVRINSELTGKSKINCGVGEIDILLVGDEDSYKITAEKGLGNISINNKNYGDKITSGEGKNVVDIEGGLGNIYIRFQK